jgi:hypothetical protein
MMLLAAIESFSFVFAAFVLLTWHSPLDVRVALAGAYVLIGTVALAAVAVLLRLNALLDRSDRRGGK